MKHSRKWLAGGVAAAALLTGTHLGVTMLTEAGLRQAIDRDLASQGLVLKHVQISANLLAGQATISDLSAEGGNLRINLGQAHVALWSPLPSPISAAFAQAETFSDLRLSFGAGLGSETTIVIKSLSVNGSPNSRSEWLALFDRNATTPLVDRVTRLSAQTITIPEVAMVQKQSDVNQSLIYRDIVLSGIGNGQIATLVIAGAGQKLEMPKTDAPKAAPGAKGRAETAAMGPMTGTYGRMETRGMNIALAARMYADPAKPGDVLETLYGESTLDKMDFRMGDQLTYKIGTIAVGPVRAKPLSVPFSEVFAIAERASKSATDGKPSVEEQKRIMTLLGSLFQSFEGGRVELRDMTMETKQNDAVKFTMARAFAGGVANGRWDEMSASGIEMTGPKQTSFKLGEFSLRGLSLASVFEALGNLDPEDPSTIDARAMIPQIEGLKISNMAFNVPDDSNRRVTNARLIGGLNNFDLKYGQYINGIPTDVGIVINNVTMELPKSTQNDQLKQLVAMGYSKLDASAVVKMRFDEPSRSLQVEEISANLVDMARFYAKANVTNVTRDLFDKDVAKMSVAGLASQVKSVDFRMDNLGGVEKALAEMAKQQRKKPADMRAELAAGAALIIPGMLGDHPAAKTVANAVAKFIAEPKSLTIGLNAKGEGLSAADFMAVASPLQVLDRVDITASAN